MRKITTIKFVQNLLPIILTAAFTIAFGQKELNTSNIVKGEIMEKLKNGDSIYFTNGMISKDYFRTHRIASEIKNNYFRFKNTLAYPQMFSVNLLSEKNVIAQRVGRYFIDRTTTNIKIDSIGECSEVNGTTQREFTQKFIPFMFQDTPYNCSQLQFSKLKYYDKAKFETKLLEYIKENPGSYVGLWFLIEQLENNGFTNLYKEGLKSFSPYMKGQRLWQTAKKKIEQIQIRKDEKFPKFELKTKSLVSQKIAITPAKYTLVDFWSSHCRPCLEAFPFMKKLYDQYRTKGFEIIGISVDNTRYIGKWQEIMEDRELEWPQFLDENGIIAKKEKIKSYPTNFLLNEKGEVIRKNIPLKELEILLEQKLDNQP